MSNSLNQFVQQNNILLDNDIYHFNQDEQNNLIDLKPWDSKPDYFEQCRISVNALIKMLIHACLGKNNEVMGFLQGRVIDKTFIIYDVLQINAKASETTVQLTEESTADVTQTADYLERIGRAQPYVGWYHSHPSYGCWLSGTDVSAQELQQQAYGAFVAIVIDPIRSMTNSKVEIGAYRVYPANYVSKQQQLDDNQLIPSEKIKDFGIHHHRYYSLNISFFCNSIDSQIVEELWKKYWGVRLAQSSLWENQKYFADGIQDLQSKSCLGEFQKQGSTGTQGSVSSLYSLDAKDVAKYSVEYAQSIVSESVKRMLFK